MNAAISKPRHRLEHIDGLRALAAIYVVMHHILLYLNEQLPLGRMRHVSDLFLFGHFAVDVFIVLSGFCLMLPVLRRDCTITGGAFSFFRKRARRILPPYFSVLALSLLLIWICIGTPRGTLWQNALPVTPVGVVSHLLVIQDWFPATSHQINYCLWSISVEWRIYFLFPALVLCWRRFGPLLTVAITSIVSFLLLIPLNYTALDSSSGGICVHYYGLFTFGMLAAGFAYSNDPLLAGVRARLPWGILCLAMTIVAFVGNKGYIHQSRLPWQLQDLFIGLATLAFLVAITPQEHSDRHAWMRNALGWRPLAFVGAFSYSLYLIHAPLLEVLWLYAVRPLHMSAVNSLLVFGSAGLLVVMALAYLFYLACERPFVGSGGGSSAGPRAVSELAGSVPTTGRATVA